MGIDKPKTFQSYLLLACDGTDINIPYNPSDKESFHQNAGKKGYNQLYLNAFFDILKVFMWIVFWNLIAKVMKEQPLTR